jgi:hypothetical protein
MMKVSCHSILLALLVSASAERAKRIPYGGTSSFPTFFSAAKASFGSSGGTHSAPAAQYPPPAPAPAAPQYPPPAAPQYSAPPAPAPAPSYPAPAPAPSYPAPAPAPSYPAPASSYPAPSYRKPEPSHNCSVQQETLQAMVCVPSLSQPECGPVTLKGVQVVDRGAVLVTGVLQWLPRWGSRRSASPSPGPSAP